MNREDIIKLAREVGINAEADALCRYEGWVEPLERFAALVASAERSECAKVCEDLDAWNEDDPGGSAAKAIRARSNT